MAIQCEPTESFAIDAGRWSEEVRKRSSEKFVHFHWKSVHKQDVKWIVQCLWLHFSNASSIIGSGSLRMICGSSDANSHVIDDRPFINEVFAQAPQCQLREIVCVCWVLGRILWCACALTRSILGMSPPILAAHWKHSRREELLKLIPYSHRVKSVLHQSLM